MTQTIIVLFGGLSDERHVSVASSNGARVNLLATLVPRGLGAGAPDATVTFTRVDGEDLALEKGVRDARV